MWENPKIYNINQLAPHTMLIPFENAKQAKKIEQEKSVYYKTLNCKWKFNWSISPKDVPENFYKDNYDDSNWDLIKVPSNWQTEGYGRVHYRNVDHAFSSNPPEIPHDYNPVGCYNKVFTIPEDWNQRKIYLHFSGVKSAFKLWINGKKVGYDQGSMTPAEFNISDYLKEGENRISVKVYRFSDGTYLECQDMIRLSGIFRNVYLYSKPQVNITDLFVKTDLDQDYENGMLKLDLTLDNNHKKVSNYSVKASLFSEEREVFRNLPLKTGIEIDSKSSKKLDFSKNIKSPEKWSAEFPNLYTLILKIYDSEGKEIEIVKEKFGFREVEVREKAIYVNGKSVKLRGVNWIPHDPNYGKAIPDSLIYQDLKMMKNNNINCIRTSHYPPSPELLELSDEYGIYIVEEANIESHANLQLSEDPDWKGAFLDRVTRMVQRDKNHPSIVVWSAGNEAGTGKNLEAVVKKGKQIDSTRAGWLYGGNSGRLPFEDIVGPRYPTVKNLQQIDSNPAEYPRPSFMDEYCHAFGNGMGKLMHYTELIRNNRRLTGGAIWDWKNQGLMHKRKIISDHSSSGSNGTLMGGAKLTSGKFGKALDLTGHDDWVELYEDPTLDITSTITVSAWIYPRKWQGINPIIAKGNEQYSLIQTAKDTLEFGLFGKEEISVKTALPSDWNKKWHHIAGTYDGARIKIYIDGQKKKVQKYKGTINDSKAPVTIGRCLGTEWFSNSLIDEVRIFDKALGLQEINKIKQNQPMPSELWLRVNNTKQKGNYLGYGIGKLPNATDGVVYADGTAQPELFQVKKAYQPLQVEKINITEGKFVIHNDYSFRNLSQTALHYKILENGKELGKNHFALRISPHKSDTIDLELENMNFKSGKEYFINFSFKTKNRRELLPDNHEIAWEQFQITPDSGSTKNKMKSKGKYKLNIMEKDKSIIISSPVFKCVLDRTNGYIDSYKYKDIEFLKEPIKFNIWKAPVLNEEKQIAEQWRKAGFDSLYPRGTSTEISKVNPGKTIIEVNKKMKGVANVSFIVNTKIEFNGNGQFSIQYNINPNGKLPDRLPKIGLATVLNNYFDKIKWYGRGPYSSYPGRKKNAKIGVYSKKINEMDEPYILPGDYGNRSDVRWATILNNEKVGWQITSNKVFNFSARPYSIENLSRARYKFQLEKKSKVYLNIDHQVSGMGTKFHPPLQQYTVPIKKYSFKMNFNPISNND